MFRLELIGFVLLLMITVLHIVRKGRITVKYALVWLFAAFLMIIAIAVPNLLEILANFMGFEVVSNMVLSLMIIMLLFVTISLTIIVSGQKEKTRILIQEVSLLKEKVETNKK